MVRRRRPTRHDLVDQPVIPKPRGWSALGRFVVERYPYPVFLGKEVKRAASTGRVRTRR